MKTNINIILQKLTVTYFYYFHPFSPTSFFTILFDKVLFSHTFVSCDVTHVFVLIKRHFVPHSSKYVEKE